jgi:hypothetical protein
MKKIIQLLLIGFVTFVILASTSQAVLIIKNFSTKINLNKNLQLESLDFEIAIENFEIIPEKNGYKVSIEEFGRLSEPGEPYLASKIFSIAIPPNAEFIDLSYDIEKKFILPSTYNIVPIPPASFNSEKNLEILKIDKEKYDENIKFIYGTDVPYPYENVKFIRTSGYRKYNLIDVQITPFTYKPVSQTLELCKKIVIHVSYQLKEDSNFFKDNIFFTELTAQNIIANYKQTQQWYNNDEILTNGVHDYVIITLDSLTSSITSLVDWEIKKGRKVEVVTIEWIDENYHGYDLAEKIRNFLREKYPSEEWGIKDVLLVGHRDELPMRRVWQSVGGDNKPETDFYYAELSKSDSDSWDFDGDKRYGENADPIDYYAEVNVGRIPWSDSETVQHICEKSVNYEKNVDPSFKKNILLLAAFVDDRTDGATFMEYIADSSVHPWMQYWSKTRMYEKDRTQYEYDFPLNRFNVVNEWSKGKYAFVCYHGHGSPTACYVGNLPFITSDDCLQLNDDYPAIIAAASCSQSDTDYNNIGQAMLKQGAVGFLGANKPAYYRPEWDHPNDGSDQSHKYFFTKQITSGSLTQGQAHQFALTEMYRKNLWNQVKYETFIHGSLWGNPNLGIIIPGDNIPPEKPTRPIGISSGQIKTEYTYTTSSTDSDGDEISYLFDWGDGSTSFILGPYSSGSECSSTNIWFEEGNYEIKVKAIDSKGAESEWSDPLTVSMPKNIYRYLDSKNYAVMDIPITQEMIEIRTNPLPPIKTDYPDFFSWKNYGGKDWTTPAKDQGNCGSCWDFAAIGTFESIIKIRENRSEINPDLSEQYVLSCLPAAANNYGQGCMGGTPYKAFYYMMNDGFQGNNQNGALPESCMPYQADDDIPCRDKCENWVSQLIPILDCGEQWIGFDSPENRDIVKSHIYENGPISAGINVTSDFIQWGNIFHNEDNIYPDTNEPWGNRLNHIIVILGWKNSDEIKNGGYWICKNSWGTNWGYDGFFNIEYGGLFTAAYIAWVDYDPVNIRPDKPLTPTGEKQGSINEEYMYSTSSFDPDNDDLYYLFDWDDRTYSQWLGPYLSGDTASISHSWKREGDYNIRVKVKDEHGYESEWSDPISINMPKNKPIFDNYFIQLFLKLRNIASIILRN